MSEQEVNEIFAKNLTKLIERKGLTQAEVAEAIGVSESAVSLWCSGKTSPRMSKVDKLCKLLQCTRSSLIYEVDPEADRAATLQRIYDKCHILFDSAEDATPEELARAAQYIEFMKTQR